MNDINNASESKRIFFPGFKNIKEVNNLINNYSQSVFVQMSYSEGQSNSILEAMARASICLVSEGCNMHMAFKEDAIVITDESNILNNINAVFNDPNRF